MATKEAMMDLIYNGEERKDHEKVKQLFIDHLPQLNLEDDWDEIHGYRLAVTGEIDTKDYFSFLIDQKLANISFMLQMSMRMPGKHQDCLREVIKDKGL